MRKNRTVSSSAGLEKKLAAYTLAGAAAHVAPAAAKADIVFVSVGQTINQPDSIVFPVLDAITITAHQTVAPPYVVVNDVTSSTGAGAEILNFNNGSLNGVAALAFGALIDPTNSDPNGFNWGSGGKLASAAGFDPGYWSTTGGSAYLGFYFGAPGSPQAGWAQIATTANDTTSSFTLISYAYETDANVAITAGEGSPVPEPSALPLLILGGAGLIALRRRRAANA